jgi:2-phospho-L-lactate guanylyltransferase (CobY/MobA/RfbA family)
MAQDCDGLIVALGDLPLFFNLTDIMAEIVRHDVVICPDRHRKGTNLLALKKASSWNFHFGEKSFAQHCDEAVKRKLTLCIYQEFQFGLDVDTYDDYMWA